VFGLDRELWAARERKLDYDTSQHIKVNITYKQNLLLLMVQELALWMTA